MTRHHWSSQSKLGYVAAHAGDIDLSFATLVTLM
jgi:hypothetical protein